MKKFEPYLYLLPAVIFFSLFVFFPFGKTIFLSFHTTNPIGDPTTFVGLKNYFDIFSSQTFLDSLLITVKYSIIIVVLSIVIGLILAIVTNENIPGSRISRTVFALPLAISGVIASVIFLYIFHPSLGTLNYILGTKIGWLNTTKWALFSVSIITVWLNLGFNFVFLLAGLQSVPKDLYECAVLDGAGFFQKHWFISIPGLSPTLFFLLIINVINSFQAFAAVKLVTQGGPVSSTNVLIYSIYQEAFMYSRFGVACAQSVVLFIILLILTLVQFKVERKVVYF